MSLHRWCQTWHHLGGVRISCFPIDVFQFMHKSRSVTLATPGKQHAARRSPFLQMHPRKGEKASTKLEHNAWVQKWQRCFFGFLVLFDSFFQGSRTVWCCRAFGKPIGRTGLARDTLCGRVVPNTKVLQPGKED